MRPGKLAAGRPGHGKSATSPDETEELFPSGLDVRFSMCPLLRRWRIVTCHSKKPGPAAK